MTTADFVAFSQYVISPWEIPCKKMLSLIGDLGPSWLESVTAFPKDRKYLYGTKSGFHIRNYNMVQVRTSLFRYLGSFGSPPG